MQTFEDGNQSLLVDDTLALVQSLTGAKRSEDVVHLCDGEARMLRLLPLAVRVERFGEFANSPFLLVCRIGKREGEKTFAVVIPWSIFKHRAGTQCPSKMNAR